MSFKSPSEKSRQLFDLTYNNSNKDFKLVKWPQEVEKFKLDFKIFYNLKIKKEVARRIRTHDLTRIRLKSGR